MVALLKGAWPISKWGPPWVVCFNGIALRRSKPAQEKCVVRLTVRPDMTLDVNRGRKTTIQQQQQPYLV